MARQVADRSIGALLDAAREWIDRYLVEDASLLAEGRGLWTTTDADRLQSGFVERPDSGGDDFMTKLERQLSDTPAAGFCYSLAVRPIGASESILEESSSPTAWSGIKQWVAPLQRRVGVAQVLVAEFDTNSASS